MINKRPDGIIRPENNRIDHPMLQQPAEQPCQEGGGTRRRGLPEIVVLREMGVGIGRGGRRIADDTAISKYF